MENNPNIMPDQKEEPLSYINDPENYPIDKQIEDDARFAKINNSITEDEKNNSTLTIDRE